MDNIVDITYNFELCEDLALKTMKDFNMSMDKVLEIRDLWEESAKLQDLENTQSWFKKIYEEQIGDDGDVYKLAYERARNDVKKIVIDSLADLKLKTKRMENVFSGLIALMMSRVQFIESSRTQDELYGNYKLRTERNDLNKKIKKYQEIKDNNLKMASEYSLSKFGLEVEGDPELE